MIIYIYGDDAFRSRRFLRQSIAEFKNKRDPQGYNTLIFDAHNCEVNKVIAEIRTVPFLAEKRMVVVENLLSAKNNDLRDVLYQLITENKIPSETILTIWQTEKINKLKEIKQIESLLLKEKYIYYFPLMEKTELSRWVEKEIMDRGGKIDILAISILTNNIGFDMWLLDSTIDQLIAYKNNEVILSEDVKLFTEEKADENIFNFIDAVVSGNKKLAYKLLNDQRKIGQEEGYIFSMILRQFKILLQVRDLWERSDNSISSDMSKELGIHPYVIKKTMPLVRRYNLDILKNIYTELYELDYKVKTGVMTQEILIDYFIGRR